MPTGLRILNTDFAECTLDCEEYEYSQTVLDFSFWSNTYLFWKTTQVLYTSDILLVLQLLSNSYVTFV